MRDWHILLEIFSTPCSRFGISRYTTDTLPRIWLERLVSCRQSFAGRRTVDPSPVDLGSVCENTNEHESNTTMEIYPPPSSLPSLPLASLSSLFDILSSSCKATRREGAIPPVFPAVFTVFVLCKRVRLSQKNNRYETDRSCLKANSNIFTRRKRSTLRFSADLLCPSNNAIRAYQTPIRPNTWGQIAGWVRCQLTYPHFGPFDLPFISIPFPTSPFTL